MLRYHAPVNMRAHSKLSNFLVCISLLLVPLVLRAQSAPTTSPTPSLIPGPKPADAPLEWKRLVGIFGQVEEPRVIILERNQKLYWRTLDNQEWPIQPSKQRVDTFVVGGQVNGEFLTTQDEAGAVVALTASFRQTPLLRVDAGSNPSHFYHIVPLRSLDQLRAAALAAKPPSEPGPFRKSDLVELATLDPAIHLDIRYAQSDNFLSTPIYSQARAFLQRPAADGLLRVLHKVQPLGYGLLIHDAYRPWYVTKIFWDATPPEAHNFVADPDTGSRHNRGCAVDLTLYDLATGKPIEMPGLYDEMSPRSFPNFPGGTSLQRWHRDLLRRAMESEGFSVYEDEWWHFDYKDWKLYSILNVPFEDLSNTLPNY